MWLSGFIPCAAIFRPYGRWKACLYQVLLIFIIVPLKWLITATYSRSMSRDPDELASIIGIMQALVSVFLDDRDKLRCINAGKTRINFLIRSPIYYASISSWGEPESVVSMCHIRVPLPQTPRNKEKLIMKKEDAITSGVPSSSSAKHCLRRATTTYIRTPDKLRPRPATEWYGIQ